MKFLELGFQNFQSYGNNLTKIDLNFNTTTLIIGKNFDSVVDGQVDSNGAGKTTILNAICYCLYDKTISKIEKNNLINDINGRNLYTYIIFEKGGKFYKIERYRKNKTMGGDGVKISINTKNDFDIEHDKTPDSTANANALILKIVGIPFEMFARIVVFSASYEPFLSLPSSHASKANQRDIIEELFGLTELSEKAEILKFELSTNKRKLSDMILVNNQIEAEIARYATLVAGYKNKSNVWDEDHARKLAEAEAKVKLLGDLDLDYNLDILQKIKKFDGDIATLNTEVKDITTMIGNASRALAQHQSWALLQLDKIGETELRVKKLSEINFVHIRGLHERMNGLNTQINTIKLELRDAASTQNQNKKVQSDMSLEISTLESNKCPYCAQSFHDTQSKMDECQSKLDDANSKLTGAESLITEKTETLNVLIEELDQIKGECQYDASALIRLEQEFTTKKVRLDELKAEINPHEINIIDQSKLIEKNTELDEYGVAIEKLKTRKNNVYKKLDVGITCEQDVFTKRSQLDMAKQTLSTLASNENPYISMIADAENVKFDELLTSDINAMDTLMRHQDFLLKLLTKKDSFIRKALLNKCLPFLNQKLNGYLSMIGLPHRVMFTEEMEAKISRFDIEIPFENLSSGQKARVNLALAFAFRDVLQSRFDKINFCILDECLDVGLGTVGVQLATNMIKTVAREHDLSMFVISHRDEIMSMFPQKLEIHMRNGFSEIAA